MYVVITYGSDAALASDKAEMEHWVDLHVDQYISDFFRHDLPLKVTDEIVRRFDLRVLKYDRGIFGAEEVQIDYQKRVDRYYQEGIEHEKELVQREWNRAVESVTKHKDRLIAEGVITGVPDSTTE